MLTGLWLGIKCKVGIYECVWGVPFQGILEAGLSCCRHTPCTHCTVLSQLKFKFYNPPAIFLYCTVQFGFCFGSELDLNWFFSFFNKMYVSGNLKEAKRWLFNILNIPIRFLLLSEYPWESTARRIVSARLLRYLFLSSSSLRDVFFHGQARYYLLHCCWILRIRSA